MDEELNYLDALRPMLAKTVNDFEILVALAKRLQQPMNVEQKETFVDMLSAMVKIKDGTITLYQGFTHLLRS